MQRVKRTTAVVALPAAPGGGTPGYFANPNPGGGVPATVPGYEWYNSVQEELCAVVVAAGLPLDINNTAQLLAALRSAGVFQTAAQFDNSAKAATTAFIKLAGKAFGGLKSIVGTTNLDTTYAGQLTIFGGTSYAVNLPAASTYPSGTTLTFFSTATGGITLNRAGADVIALNSTSTTNSLIMGGGDTLTLVSNGTAIWEAVAGSSQMGFSAAFGSLPAANGYQKLPSGLIFQWGSISVAASSIGTVTYPIAFPSALLAVFATNGFSSYTPSSTPFVGISPTGTPKVSATVQNGYSASGNSINWFALGN